MHFLHGTLSYHLLWNDLPKRIKDAPSLSTFKTALKTHLFTIAFLS